MRHPQANLKINKKKYGFVLKYYDKFNHTQHLHYYLFIHLPKVLHYYNLVKTVDSVEDARLLARQTPNCSVLFTSEQLEKKWRPGLHP